MNKLGTSRQRLKKDKMPLILMAAGLLTLIVFFLVLFPKNQESDNGVSSDQFRERLSQLEERLVSLEEEMNRKFAQTGERNDKELETFSGKLSGLEDSVTLRMDNIVKRLDTLQNRKATAKSKPARRKPAAKAPEKKRKAQTKTAPQTKKTSQAAKPPPIRPNALYHVVREGETLYQISRSYSISIEELHRFNNITPGTPIHPGQKLMVKER